jgi:hypothetical protein
MALVGVKNAAARRRPDPVRSGRPLLPDGMTCI